MFHGPMGRFQLELFIFNSIHYRVVYFLIFQEKDIIVLLKY